LRARAHRVVLHARNADRAEEARRALPKAEAVLVGDVETIAGAKDIASQANALGRFDAVIHNAAVGYQEGHRVTSDGLPHVFAINTLSAYILTALLRRPKRLVYLSSGMHHHANTNLDDILWKKRRWNGSTAYAESKLHDAMLAFAIARCWPGVFSNALEPGWVPTKMGGSGAPDDIDQAHLTQVWLAAGDDPKADVLFLPPEAHGAERASPGSGTARPPHRNLRRGLRRAAAGLSSRDQSRLRLSEASHNTAGLRDVSFSRLPSRLAFRRQIGCRTMKASRIASATAPSRGLKQWASRATSRTLR
jgi:NAD(P)-dependent dehydrogenase (short-subunit alcohol dehydrogenase family)